MSLATTFRRLSKGIANYVMLSSIAAAWYTGMHATFDCGCKCADNDAIPLLDVSRHEQTSGALNLRRQAACLNVSIQLNIMHALFIATDPCSVYNVFQWGKKCMRRSGTAWNNRFVHNVLQWHFILRSSPVMFYNVRCSTEHDQTCSMKIFKKFVYATYFTYNL